MRAAHARTADTPPACARQPSLRVPCADLMGRWVTVRRFNEAQTKSAPLPISRVFDFTHLTEALRPCRFVTTASGGMRRRPVELAPLRDGWAHTRTLRRVYAAVQPSNAVRALVDDLVAAAVRHAGPRWAAVHLPIERDWWWDTSFCSPRRAHSFLQRCFAPSEVAEQIRDSLAMQRATGVVLLYAHDKVSSLGPPVCHAAFGRPTFKLLLNATLPYTLRNAAEQFLAARAPTGFYGNALSTFSKGVATMRESSDERTNASFAYDCTLSLVQTRRFVGRPRESIVSAHPGFRLLQPVRPERCR